MKLRNKILAIAVAAVAGVNVYFANNTNSTKHTDLQLTNIESIAEAQESEPIGCVACWNSTCRCKSKDGMILSFAHYMY